jgi:hypothetical protein
MAGDTQGKLKDSVYALEDPSVPGLYIRLGNPASLTHRTQASLAPATFAGRLALCQSAIKRNTPHGTLVRLDA